MEDERCKGTKICAATETLDFDDYKTCLFDGKIKYRERLLFENKKLKVDTINKHLNK